MTALTDLARDERSAGMVPAIVCPLNHASTGNLIARVGAADTVAFIENDNESPA